MGFAKIQSVALAGLEAVPVSVEVDVHSYDDKLSVVMVGLPDTAVRE